MKYIRYLVGKYITLSQVKFVFVELLYQFSVLKSLERLLSFDIDESSHNYNSWVTRRPQYFVPLTRCICLPLDTRSLCISDRIFGKHV